MNCETGDLYKRLNLVPEIERKSITQVPVQYEKEAMELLSEQEHVKVDMSKSSPLVDWANRQSKKKKRQMVKNSKKANRRRKK